MITDKESTLSLRVSSKSLNCTEISKVLDWKPSEKFEIGELFGGRFSKRVRKESLWIYNLDLDEKTLFEEQLKILIDSILKKKENFQKILNDCQIDIFCGYTTYNGQGGFTLEANLMRELVLLNIDFSIDFYALKKTFDQALIKSE